MKLKSVILFGILIGFFPGACLADTIVSKNGKTIEGKIRKESKDSYVIEIPGVGELTIQKSEVQSVKRATAAAPIAENPAKPKKSNLVINQKIWKVAYEHRGKQMQVVQFIPEGFTLENSHELVTLEFFPGAPTDKKSLEKGIDQTKATLQKSCPSLQFRQAAQSDREILYQWQIGSCKNLEDQCELVRVKAVAGGLEVIHYAAKKRELSEPERQQWMLWLSHADLSEALVDKPLNKV
jgi:hypothetical protein